jgi:nitroreductase
MLTRRSRRKYLDKEVTEDLVEKLIDAAKAAPSSKDCQPWHFVAVRSGKQKGEIAALKEDENRFLRDAPLLIVVCVDTTKSQTRWVEDGAIAAHNIALAANALGLGAVWITGWCGWGRSSSPGEEGLRKLLALPENIRPVCIVALGWPDPSEKVEEKILRPTSEILHNEGW